MFIVCTNSFSQYKLTLKEGNQHKLTSYETSNSSAFKTAKSSIPYIFYTMVFINPMLVIEDKKAHFGLTKEISFGYYPYGRLAIEYSFIFRDYNTSHFRFSYNFDIILEARDIAAFNLTPGVGYFTDSKNKGWFAHASFGVIIPAFVAAVNPYIRYRHTFVQNKSAEKTDIDDISLGMGFMFYFND